MDKPWLPKRFLAGTVAICLSLGSTVCFAAPDDPLDPNAGGISGPGANNSTTSTDTSAPTSGPPLRKYSVGVQFDYELGLDLVSNTNALGLMGAQLQGFRILASAGYQITRQIQARAYLGSSMNGQLTGTNVIGGANTVTQVFNFDNSLTYGFSLAMDVIPSSRFHLTPILSWLHAGYSGNLGTVTNSPSGCTYDYSTNGTGSSCVTLGGNLAGGVESASFSEYDFTARLEFGWDIGGDLYAPLFTVRAGVEEAMVSLRGSVNYANAGNTFSETYDFDTARADGYYGGLDLHIAGMLVIGGEFHAINQNMITAFTALSF